MAVSIALIALLLAAAAATAGIAAFLRRPLPRLFLAAFVVLACLPFPKAFVTNRTILPLDHVGYTIPWASPVATAPYNPYLNDVVTQILPWAKATRLAWKDGEAPWRNRWNGCSMPLAANSVSAALSPLTFLTLVLPLAQSYTFLAALRLLLAACGTWLWVRELGAPERAALFAATVFALSFSFTPPWLLFPQSVEIALWPWVLFLFERLLDERGRGRAIAALTLLFVLMMLAGHPETAVIGFVFAALWFLIRWIAGDLPRPGRVFGAIAFSAAVAVGTTAFLLVPSLYAIAGSGRLADARKPYWEPILSLAPHAPSWRMLPTSLFPHTLGNAIVSPTLPVSGASFPENTLGYFGIVGWAAALLFFRPGSRHSVKEWALFGLLVCGWACSVGIWPFAEIISFTPGLRYLFPVRLHSWEGLAGSALAALELDRLVRDARERGVGITATIAVPAALGALAIAVYLGFSADHADVGGLGPAFQARRLAVTLFVLGMTAILLALVRRRPGPAILALTALAAAELLYQWRGLFRLSPPEGLFPDSPLVAFLKSQPRPFRVVGKGPALFPSTNVFAGVEDIRTHDAIERYDYLEFLDRTAGYVYRYFKSIRNLDAPALDFLNVRYLVAAPDAEAPGPRWRLAYSGADGRVFENPAALARAFVPGRVRLVASPVRAEAPLSNANAAFGEAGFREIAANWDWGGRAWILSETGGEVSGGRAEISGYVESTNTAAFRARVTEEPAYVVLSVVQDGGWSASSDTGAKLPVLRANGPFLALRLPAGETRVRLRYRPPGAQAGALFGLTGAALLCAAGVAMSRRRPRSPA
ncbi:MAG: hypothetical protein WAU32_10485 [Thermoanaerobaculia bacterium]